MSSRRTNRSELDDLTTAQRTAVSDGAVALDNLTGRASFNAWMQVARGIVPLCALADKPGRSRNARRSLFKEAGYGSLSAANVSRLLWMGRFESQIAIWRMGLKPRQRDTWNSPATICKRCPEVRKAIEEANKNRPPRQAPRPRPAANPVDELERTINRTFDLLNAVGDLDLRRQQIERLSSLLNELSEPERQTKAATIVAPAPPSPKPALTLKNVGGDTYHADVGGGMHYVLKLREGAHLAIFGSGKMKNYKEWEVVKHLGNVNVPWKFMRAQSSKETAEKRAARKRANDKSREASLEKATAIAQRDYERYS